MDTISPDVDYAMGWAWAGVTLRVRDVSFVDVDAIAPRQTASFLSGARHKIATHRRQSEIKQ